MYSKIISIFNNTIANDKNFFYINKSVKYLKFLNLLLNENFIMNCKLIQNPNKLKSSSGNNTDLIKISLIKRNNIFLIRRIKQVSRGGKPFYIKSNKIRLKINSSSILLTNKGLMLDFKAKKLNLGGEVICIIFF